MSHPSAALAPAPVQPNALAIPPSAPGLLRGIKIFFHGFGTLLSMPGAYPLAMVPVIASLALIVGLSTLSVAFVPDLVAWWAGDSTSWWVAILQVLAALVAVVLSVFVGLGLAQPLSGPALEALVRITERKLGDPVHPDTPFLTDIVRSAGSAFLGFAFGAPLFVLLLLIGLIPGAAVVTVPLKFLLATVIVGWDVCDYPLSVRGVPLRQRLRFMVRHIWAILGFSAGIALVCLVPCGLFLVLPAGVVGATILVSEIERAEAAKVPRLG